MTFSAATRSVFFPRTSPSADEGRSHAPEVLNLWVSILDAIIHCKELAQHFRDGSLRDDKELEIAVVTRLGGRLHREFLHPE
jgi:hypothetical protein